MMSPEEKVTRFAEAWSGFATAALRGGAKADAAVETADVMTKALGERVRRWRELLVKDGEQ